MTVRDLIAALEDFDPEAEVLITSLDPWWRLRYTLAAAVDPHDVDDVDDSGQVYLLSGDHPAGSPYTPDSVLDAAAS